MIIKKTTLIDSFMKKGEDRQLKNQQYSMVYIIGNINLNANHVALSKQ